MSDYNDYEEETGAKKGLSFMQGWHPSVQAALIFALPFIVVDFFNYYTAGTALVLSLPVLALLYAGCGALAAKFASSRGGPTNIWALGALAGLFLWLISTIVNTIVGLILGTASLGVTLLLGIPYLCLCAPFQLVGGVLMGTLGGFITSLFFRGSTSSDNYGE